MSTTDTLYNQVVCARCGHARASHRAMGKLGGRADCGLLHCNCPLYRSVLADAAEGKA